MTNEELDTLDVSSMDPLTFALREEVIMLREEKAELDKSFDSLRLEHNMVLRDRDRLAAKLANREVLVVVAI